MAGRKSDFTLPTLDDLFSTQELRDDAKLSKIRDIPLELIDDFPDHPFKVRDDEDMIQLVESVKERGVITPATVRQKEDGRYELISGHRRKRACELAGFENLRCEVVDLDRDAATVLMVESNYQRSQILPSEKAFAYKMRLEAMSRQGKRTDLTSDPVGPKLSGERSNIELSSETGDSTSQIKRYIRLTSLVPELLDLVDEGKIKMRPAVELSYLDEDNQRAVVDEIDLNQCTPSHDQTIRMRKFFTDGKLTPEVVSAIMGEEKPNQREKIVLRGDKVRSLIPKNIPVMMYGAQNGITVKSNSDSELGMRLVAYLSELHCAVDIAGATVTEKREQSVKAHICQSNRLGYYLIKRTTDTSQMAAEIKTLFIRNHIYLHTDSEKDVQVLRERFLEWKNRNACKLNGKY